MTWREELRRVEVGGRLLVGASFRGVPFFVESSETSGGRRVVVHELPLRDAPVVEDLGRKARSFRVDGYTIGDDYIAQRDALIEALENIAGPGDLIHPYHGRKRAICVGLSVRESKSSGGMATFAIDFAEAPSSAPAPTADADAGGRVSSSSSAAVAASAADLTSRVNYLGVPAFALASAERVVVLASEALRAALAPLAQTTQELAELSSSCALLAARAASLVRQPAELLSGFRGAIGTLSDSMASVPGLVLRALLDSYGADVGSPVAGATGNRQIEAANHSAISQAVRLEMLTVAARLATSTSYASLEDAIAIRDRIAGHLETQAQDASDAMYPYLVQLRSDLLRAVPGGRAMARLLDVERVEPVPSLLLAYQVYGSVDKELDVVARNPGIEHPGFVAGTIQVLSDG